MVDLRLEPLARHHDRGAFECGEPSVTQYLRAVAMQAQEAMRASTKVAVRPSEPERILGYLTIVMIKIIDKEMPDDLVTLFKIRNLASGAPAVLLAQLGVDRRSAGEGLGTFLLQQALRQALVGALTVGGVALIVDALSEEIAAQWYVNHVPDFRPLTPNGLRLILPMRTLAASWKPEIPR